MRRSYGVTYRAPSWLVFLFGGVIAAGLYAIDVAAVAAFSLVGAACAAALLMPRRGRAPHRPWQLLGCAALLLLTGALVRPLVAGAVSPVFLLADAFTLPGFILVMAGLGAFLRASGGVDRHALIDGLIVCIGAAVGCVLVFVLPATSVPGRPLEISILAGLFPLIDAFLLLLLVNLAFTTTVRQPSVIMLLAMMVSLFAGDLGYAHLSLSGDVYGSRMLDLPFILAYTLCGAAALHPSAATVIPARRRRVQPWSLPRLLVIGPAVALPFVLTIVRPATTATERVILGVGGALIVVLLILRAVTAVQSLAAARRHHEHQAAHDPLTGLPNRHTLFAVVDRLLAGPGPADTQVWMFFVDLDGFKFVNDSWGHPAGDQLIIDVGHRLRAMLPEAATVARIGGDEFIIVRRCTENEAFAQARQIMSCVEQPLRVASTEVVISASMGIAAAAPDRPGGPVTAESLMRDADTAMYRTKAQGRGRWTVFDPSMRDAVRERIDIEVALRAAVAQEHLTVAYQPIVDLGSGRLAGAEALVRWNHPVRGTIQPNVFIPIAEDSNLISAVGAWVLRRSIRQLGTWRSAGVVSADFWMSINVSPRQLCDHGFAKLLADELAHSGVPAGRIVLEITESVMVAGGEATEQVLRDLRKLGVGVSVDDFGTGFSALGYLRRHPVTGVKIDRSFVAGLAANAEDEEIVRAVVAMSSALDLAVVAEGVETSEQQAVLAGLGVTLAQGWLWGRAVEPGRFAERWTVPDPDQLRDTTTTTTTTTTTGGAAASSEGVAARAR